MDILTLIRKIADNQSDCVAFCSLDSGDVVTYAELVQGADDTAKWLRLRGCRPGERCGLIMADGSQFLQSALGILSAGLCVAPIATSLPPCDKDRAMNAAGLQWLLQANRQLLRLPFAHAVDPGARELLPLPGLKIGDCWLKNTGQPLFMARRIFTIL